MNVKKLTTIVLIVFVLASIAVLAVKEFSAKKATAADGVVEGTKIVAYYFHGTKRCPTCTKIERYSQTVIDSFFTQPIKEGKFEFVTMNYDEPQNEHVWNEYQLAAQSLVLVHYKDGVQQKWENLSRIWELVGDEDQFYAYVKDGIDRYLRELP
jgi:hypothetical protein